MINRREFLHDSVLASAAFLAMPGARSRRFLIETLPQASPHRRLAERELLRGLSRLQLGSEIRFASRMISHPMAILCFGFIHNVTSSRIRKPIRLPCKAR